MWFGLLLNWSCGRLAQQELSKKTYENKEYQKDGRFEGEYPHMQAGLKPVWRVILLTGAQDFISDTQSSPGGGDWERGGRLGPEVRGEDHVDRWQDTQRSQREGIRQMSQTPNKAS